MLVDLSWSINTFSEFQMYTVLRDYGQFPHFEWKCRFFTNFERKVFQQMEHNRFDL